MKNISIYMPPYQQSESYLKHRSIPYKLMEYPASINSSSQAAKELGVSLNQMLKSLLFKIDDEYALFLIPVLNKVDMNKVYSHLGKQPKLASKDEVLAVTGCHLGTVCPFNLTEETNIYLQESILDFPEVCIASGTKGIEISLKPQDLADALTAKLIDLVQNE